MTSVRRCARLIAAATVLVVGVAAGTGESAAATPGVPYSDPDAVGYIGLCDQAGQQVTSGLVSATPFAWRAVSSVAAPAGYNGPTRSATLMAFLPMHVLPPGDWSGEQLTAATRYTNPAVPMAEATASDESLQTFVNDFPPELDGFVQLRLILTAANQEPQSTRYPALDIQVTGTTWQAVGGGPVDCTSGTAVSVETLLPAAATTAPGKGTGGGNGSGSTAVPPGGSNGSGKGTGTGSGGSAPGSDGSSGTDTAAGVHPESRAPTPSSSSVTTSHLPLVVAIVMAALAVLGTLVFLFLRRRREPDPTPSPPTTDS